MQTNLSHLLPLVFLLSACGTAAEAQPTEDSSVTVAYPEKYPDVRAFMEEYILNFGDLPEFVAGAVKSVEVVESLKETNAHSVGRCAVSTDPSGRPMRGTGQIELLRSYWEQANEWQKRALIWHENAHCFQGLGHIENRVHLMNGNLPDSNMLRDQWNYFMEELRRTSRDESRIGSGQKKTPEQPGEGQ